MLNSFCVSIIINAGGHTEGIQGFIVTLMLVGVGLFNLAGCAALLCLLCLHRSNFIFGTQLSFCWASVGRKMVKAALSEVNCVFCLCPCAKKLSFFIAALLFLCIDFLEPCCLPLFCIVCVFWCQLIIYCTAITVEINVFSFFISPLCLFFSLLNFLSCVSQTRTPRVTRLSPTQPALADQASRVSFASAENLETMSEPDIPIGFNRMNRLRQSLPLARSSSQAKLRAPGQTIIFIVHMILFIFLPCTHNHMDCCWHVILKRGDFPILCFSSCGIWKFSSAKVSAALPWQWYKREDLRHILYH